VCGAFSASATQALYPTFGNHRRIYQQQHVETESAPNVVRLLSAETECPPKVPICAHSAPKPKSKFGRPLHPSFIKFGSRHRCLGITVERQWQHGEGLRNALQWLSRYLWQKEVWEIRTNEDGRRLDSAPSANVVAMATKISPPWSSPLVGPNISGLSGIQADL